MDVVLKIEGLRKHFGSVRAVDGIDLEVREGEFTAVIGPNGAGKTTFFHLVTGAAAPDEGRVYLAGQDITGWPPASIVRAGLARTFQITSVFPDLTALENVLLPCLARQNHTARFWPDHARHPARQTAFAMLKRVGLAGDADRPCRMMSHADQKLVEVAMALATEPRVLLLDEPAAGLAPGETDRVIGTLRDVAASEGVTMVLIEHDMDIVFSMADRVVVLHQGRVLADGPPEDIRRNPTVKEVYLGGTFAGRG
ncbi:MAG: ABC transporter ATP-binding protein [Firmicutes bacterium]|nr:ABC transporter ATP-binding protein [Bacillota bacterium]